MAPHSSGGKFRRGHIDAPSGVPRRVLLDLDQLGVRYSNVVIAVLQDFCRKPPATVEGMVRAYTEGVAAEGYRQIYPSEGPETDRGAL